MEMRSVIPLRVVLLILPIHKLMFLCSVLTVVVRVLADIIGPTIIHCELPISTIC